MSWPNSFNFRPSACFFKLSTNKMLDRQIFLATSNSSINPLTIYFPPLSSSWTKRQFLLPSAFNNIAKKLGSKDWLKILWMIWFWAQILITVSKSDSLIKLLVVEATPLNPQPFNQLCACNSSRIVASGALARLCIFFLPLVVNWKVRKSWFKIRFPSNASWTSQLQPIYPWIDKTLWSWI